MSPTWRISSATNLIKLCNRPTVVTVGYTNFFVHPTYQSCASDLPKLCIRPIMLCFRPTNIVHPTNKYCASELQILCIRPTEEWNQLRKAVQPDILWVWYTVGLIYCGCDILTFFNEVCIRPTVHRTNNNLKLLKNHVRIGPKFRRTDIRWVDDVIES